MANSAHAYPRIWDIVFHEFQSELDRRSSYGADRAALEAEVMAEQRQNLLGGRFVWAVTGSAPMSAEMKVFVKSYLDLHLVDGYGSTEAGAIFVDGQVRRPPVTDYKLADAPDLGYFHTDQPHPRGELLVMSDDLFPRYYKRPEVTAEVFDADGYYRTIQLPAIVVAHAEILPRTLNSSETEADSSPSEIETRRINSSGSTVSALCVAPGMEWTNRPEWSGAPLYTDFSPAVHDGNESRSMFSMTDYLFLENDGPGMADYVTGQRVKQRKPRKVPSMQGANVRKAHSRTINAVRFRITHSS